jgi:hypothetical protein
MNAHIDDPAHQEAQEALPWLANGSLAGAELRRVQAHVEACAQCRADLAMLHTLRAAGEASEPACDPDRALARLLPQLETPPASGEVPGWRARFAANDRSWMRAAIAVQCCVIAALAVVLAGHQRNADVRNDAYRVLGASPGTTARLVVMFKPDTPERELRRIVRGSGARIVGGPTVTDAYLLDADGDPAAALARLRAEGAVTLVEPLATGGQP